MILEDDSAKPPQFTLLNYARGTYEISHVKPSSVDNHSVLS